MRFADDFRETACLLIAVAIVLAIAAISFRSWTSLDVSERQLAAAQRIEGDATDVLSLLKDAETGQRGFLLTGSEDYLDPYRRAVSDLRSALGKLTADAPPDQLSRTLHIVRLSEQKVDELSRTIDLSRKGDRTAALDIVRSNQGKQIMDEIRVAVAELQSVSVDRLRRFTEENKRNSNTLGLVASAGSSVLFLLLAAATLLIRRTAADLRESERRSKESHEWLDTTLRSIGDGVIATDPQGRIVFMNDVARTLTGWTREEAAGSLIETIFDIHNEDTGAIVENPVRRALAEGRIVGLANHTVLISKDGRHIPIDDSAAPIRRPGEPPGGVVLVFRDVSERKEVEHRAKSTADQIRAIVEANPIGVIKGDIHGRVNYANDAYLDIIGYTRDDLENGRVDWKAITPPEWLPLDLNAIAEAAQRGVCTPYEKEYVRRDGSRIPVYIGFALVGEQRDETIAFILDLTERRRAEEQFTRQLRRLVESNIVGIAVATTRHVIDANDMFLRMVGHSRDDIAARRVEWLQSDNPEATENDRAALRELRERGVCAPYEKEYVRSDGTRVPILIGAAVVSESPELTWISFVADLTTHKSLEGRLVSANERLSKANEELERFAYVVAHDLQSPLRTVSSMTALLTRKLHGSLDHDTGQLATFIQGSVKHMSSLIAGLLEYARVATAEERQLRPIDCGALFSVVKMNLEVPIAESAAVLTAEPLPVVQADEQLARVFQNLVENALKYRSADPPRIHVAAERAANEWTFRVSDNGIGFDMQYADRVFAAFQRLHSASAYEGSGIGLAICKRTIERYGGRMWVKSAPGEGSTFYFTVPANKAS